MKKFALSLYCLPALFLYGCSAATVKHLPVVSQAKPKNIIFMIGDGMGPEYTSSYRYYYDDPSTKIVESTIFDELLVGNITTYPLNSTVVNNLTNSALGNQKRYSYITDSAAAGTALSSGVKTYNGFIAMDQYKKPTLTVLEYAKQLGKQTAIVATSRIAHATPASFMSHNESRNNYSQIADSYYDQKINGSFAADLMLGGGIKNFQREDRNLIKEFQQSGYHFVSNLSELSTVEKLPVLGLFSKSDMPYVLDSKDNHLTKMTTAALRLLDQNNDKGFFIMIEGSRIDHCGHANDSACVFPEMNDFALSIKKVKEYIDQHPDTLLVVTADHSTGGLTIGANSSKKFLVNALPGVKYTLDKLTDLALQSERLKTFGSDYLGFELTQKELLDLDNAKKVDSHQLRKTISSIVNARSNISWGTPSHTSVDVQVFAYGKGASEFIGQQDNTDMAKKLFKLMGKKE